MALIEQTKLDRIEIVGDFKHIQCRHDNQIIDDVTGEVKSKDNFHRHVLSPGDDVSGEPAEIQAIAATMWTQEIIDGYAAFQAAQIKVQE